MTTAAVINARYQAAHLDAIGTLDIGFFSATMDPKPSADVMLAGLHKARYECPAVVAYLRHASRDWLVANGLGRMDGKVWPAGGELPR